MNEQQASEKMRAVEEQIKDFIPKKHLTNKPPRVENVTTLLEEAAGFIVETAQRRLTAAQNELEEEKARADRIRQFSRAIQDAIGIS